MTHFITLLQTWLGERRDDERGVTAVEYGLMIAFIAAVIAVGAGLLGTNLNTLFNNAATYVANHSTF
jgi:pilus assembly protein Flp/PilA